MNEKLFNFGGIARLAGVSRGAVVRQVALGILKPDGVVAFGPAGRRMPLFAAHRAIEVLKHVRVPPHRAQIKNP